MLDIQEQVASNCVSNGVRRGNYFGGQLIKRTEVEVRVRKFKNGKAAGKNEVTGEMIKVGSNMAFESSVVPEDWRSTVVVPLYKGKEMA